MAEPPSAEPDAGSQALFCSWDSHLIANIVAFGTGLTAMSGGGGSPAVGAVADLGPRGSQLPHWILVQTDEHGVSLFASDRSGTKGRQLVEASRDTFRATLNRNIGQILLMLFVPGHPSIALKGKWGPLHREPIRVARAVMTMAKVS
jgi:hypothetical protein